MACNFIPLSTLEATLSLLPTPLILPEHLSAAVAKRQRDYLAGRACAQFLYAKYRVPWDGLLTYPDTHPQRGAPQWPEGFVGSISHSKDLAVACMYPGHEVRSVGLDTESIMSPARAEQLRSQILHPREDWVSSPLELTLVFSLKESIYKALHPLLQRFIGFQEVWVQQPQCPTFAHSRFRTLRLSWRPEEQLAKDIKAHLGSLQPPAFEGSTQWWVNTVGSAESEPTGFVLTHYSI